MDNNVSKDSLGFLSAFNLKTTPFTSSIDTGNLCQSRQFKDTLARLCYAAENRMFAVLTGPVGVGKSTVLRAFNDAIDSSRFEVLYISQSNLSPRWLYSIPLSQLGINAKFYANDAKKQFHEQLLSITTVKKKQVVMIIDEAHLINHRTLQEIRFLLNCRFDAGNPLSLIIAGQNELYVE
jgi:type II secretory pathway predicted ATPase ExeA